MKAIWIVHQNKLFYKKRPPKFSCMPKLAAKIGILIASREGNRKIMQFRITNTKPKGTRNKNIFRQFQQIPSA